MRWLSVVALLSLLYVGCSITNFGTDSSEREYRDIADINASEDARVELHLTMPIAKEETRISSGSASSRIDPVLTAAWDAAQGMATKDGYAFMKDIMPVLEKWIKKDAENVDDHSTAPLPPKPLPVPPEPVPEPDITTSYLFPCEDLNFTYNGIEQLVCLFEEFDSCDQIPFDAFTMVWNDSSGNKRELEVPNKCTIAMDSEEDGVGKYRPAHDKEPYKPVAYAPRGFNAIEVAVIGKK